MGIQNKDWRMTEYESAIERLKKHNTVVAEELVVSILRTAAYELGEED